MRGTSGDGMRSRSVSGPDGSEPLPGGADAQLGVNVATESGGLFCALQSAYAVTSECSGRYLLLIVVIPYSGKVFSHLPALFADGHGSSDNVSREPLQLSDAEAMS